MSLPQQSQKTTYKRPFLRLLAGQAGAGILVVMLDVVAGSWMGPMLGVGAGVGLEVWVLVAIQAVLAPVITLLLGLGRGWALVQFFLPWATWGALYLNIPSWVYFACFILTYALYKNVGAERVPLYLSNRITWRALEGLIEGVNLKDSDPEGSDPEGSDPEDSDPEDSDPEDSDPEDGVFIDLGSGFGGIVSYLGGKYPEWKFEGIESAPLTFIISWFRTLIGMRGNVSVRFGDMWDTDLSQYNVVYAFLSPAPMAKLLEKAKNEMRPGSVLISNSFWADGVEFDKCLELADGRTTKLYIKFF